MMISSKWYELSVAQITILAKHLMKYLIGKSMTSLFSAHYQQKCNIEKTSPAWSPDVREFSCWLFKMAFGPMHAPDKVKIWLKLLPQMLSNSDALLQTEVFVGIFSFSDGFAIVRLVFSAKQ